MDLKQLEDIANRKTTCHPFGETVSISRAERDALVALAMDGLRYRWLHDHACNSLHLTRDDDHACNYMTAAEWIERCPEDFQDDPPEEIERMKSANTIWRLQVYPNTPIGFWVIHASTLSTAIDAAMAAEIGKNMEKV
ncbi:hypothetical protein [Achromobacter ruhlandii]|uniref:hypothetical protein n=1 Tax=Achromobacter ruhlandii TaxID=72557 RepID=UPI0007BF5613|nr:hypothetical protein [Achromobacter ruhlandii]